MLIDSFKSTLLESLEAKLLLHVVDVNDPQILEKIAVVEDILKSLKANQPMILVLNKVDLVNKESLADIEKSIETYFSDKNSNLQSIQKISAQTGSNIQSLIAEIEDFF